VNASPDCRHPEYCIPNDTAALSEDNKFDSFIKAIHDDIAEDFWRETSEGSDLRNIIVPSLFKSLNL
jgi:hypothetical protein